MEELGKTVLERLKEVKEKHVAMSGNTLDFTAFNSTLRASNQKLIEECLKFGMNVNDPNTDINTVLRAFNETEVSQSLYSGKSPIQVGYYLLANSTLQYQSENKEYRDVKNEALEADLRSRRRYLRYRIYTALGIASVVLFTGAAAQYFGIPLPLLRIPT